METQPSLSAESSNEIPESSLAIKKWIRGARLGVMRCMKGSANTFKVDGKTAAEIGATFVLVNSNGVSHTNGTLLHARAEIEQWLSDVQAHS